MKRRRAFELLLVVGVLLVLFKLSGQLTWSWTAVLAPFWGIIAVGLGIVVILASALGLALAVGAVSRLMRER